MPTWLYLECHSNRTVFLCGYETGSSLPLQVLGGMFQAAVGVGEGPRLWVSKRAVGGPGAWSRGDEWEVWA